MLHVAEFQHPEKLWALRESWEELWEATRRRSVFQSWDWYRNLLDESRGERQPRVLLVTLAGKPIGLLPLVQRCLNTPFGPARVWELPETPFGIPLEVVGPHPAATWMACLRHLRQRRRGWDVLRFSSETSEGGRRIANAFRCAGLTCHRTLRPVGAVLPLGQMRKGEGLSGSLSADWQRQFLQAEHRLRRFGHLRFVRFSPRNSSPRSLQVVSDPVSAASLGGRFRWDLYTAFLRAARCPLGSAQPSLTEEAGRRAFNVLHEIGTVRKAIDLSLLLVNDRPAAAAYCLDRNGEIQALRLGRAADFTRDALDVLLGFLWRDSLQRGDVSFRFPPGSSHAAVTETSVAQSGTCWLHYHPFRLRARWLQWKGRLSGRGQAADENLATPHRGHPARRRSDSALSASSLQLTTVG